MPHVLLAELELGVVQVLDQLLPAEGVGHEAEELEGLELDGIEDHLGTQSGFAWTFPDCQAIVEDEDAGLLQVFEALEAPVSDEPRTHSFIDRAHALDELSQLPWVTDLDTSRLESRGVLLVQVEGVLDLLLAEVAHLAQCNRRLYQLSVLLNVPIPEYVREALDLRELVLGIGQDCADIGASEFQTANGLTFDGTWELAEGVLCENLHDPLEVVVHVECAHDDELELCAEDGSSG